MAKKVADKLKESTSYLVAPNSADPKKLKGRPVDKDDPNVQGGVDIAIGVQTAPDEPDAQLDVRFRDGNTYCTLHVHTVKGASYDDHWMFTGIKSADDLRINWEYGQEKLRKAKQKEKELAPPSSETVQ
jgi:hypothetical protein